MIGQETSPSTVGNNMTDSENKVQQLAESINNVESIEKHLMDLVCQITGEPSKALNNTAEKLPPVNILAILNQGGAQLSNQVARLHDCICDIERMLR